MILTEKRLWVTGTKKQQDLQVLFQQDNSEPENLSSILDETLKSLGDWTEFVSEYHLEFNFIDI